MDVIISNPQNRVKSVYCPVPKIDLTFRINGEEKPCLIDSLGNVVSAGIDAPTVASTVTITTTATASFDPSKFWNYGYVYVAKTKYPLVENAVTGGGSPAPRSNPSPSVQATSNTGTDNNKVRKVTIPTSQRTDISHIWIYRTGFFATADEATNDASGGLMFWIGEIANNPNFTTVDFLDNSISAGLEQIETDNFVAPQARLAIYSDPFFFTIGNDILKVEVNVTTGGLVTIVDQINNRWYNGRDGQVATFDGIATGGFDGNGHFYVKITDNYNLQLYSDIGLTIPIGLSSSGKTNISIKGQSTILYRSKPRNPFSWGQTDLVNDLQVPSPYNFSVGGGRATAIGLIPNLNLLKIDTQEPQRTYTLNLKVAGTPNFEPSLRPISDSYCTSNHFSQFSATVANGLNQVWGLDTKTFSIVQCDGSYQRPISDAVCKTLRNLSLDGSDREFFHGVYHPRLELNCMFVRIKGSQNYINLCVFQHWPSGYWGTTAVYDVNCSAQIFDPFVNQIKVLVGTSTGIIGEFAAENQWTNWFPSGGSISGQSINDYSISDGEVYAFPYNVFTYNGNLGDLKYVINNWMIVADKIIATNVYQNFRYCRISKVESVIGPIHTYSRITCDVILDFNFQNIMGRFPYPPLPDSTTVTTRFAMGIVEVVAGKFFTIGMPFEPKKLEEVKCNVFWPYYTDFNPDPLGPTIEFGSNYHWPEDGQSLTQFSPRVEMGMIPTVMSIPPRLTNSEVWSQFMKQDNFLLDSSAVIGIQLAERGVDEICFMGYEISFSSDALNQNGNNT